MSIQFFDQKGKRVTLAFQKTPFNKVQAMFWRFADIEMNGC